MWQKNFRLLVCLTIHRVYIGKLAPRLLHNHMSANWKIDFKIFVYLYLKIRIKLLNKKFFIFSSFVIFYILNSIHGQAGGTEFENKMWVHVILVKNLKSGAFLVKNLRSRSKYRRFYQKKSTFFKF